MFNSRFLWRVLFCNKCTICGLTVSITPLSCGHKDTVISCNSFWWSMTLVSERVLQPVSISALQICFLGMIFFHVYYALHFLSTFIVCIVLVTGWFNLVTSQGFSLRLALCTVTRVLEESSDTWYTSLQGFSPQRDFFACSLFWKGFTSFQSCKALANNAVQTCNTFFSIKLLSCSNIVSCFKNTKTDYNMRN